VAKSEIVVALDIGTTKVCTLVAEVSGEDHVAVLGVGLAPSTGMRKGVVTDISETANAIRESVAAAELMSGVNIAAVYVGITGEHIASINSRGTIEVTHEITEEHVQQARHAARQVTLGPDREILHNIPRQYLVDGQEGVRHPVGMSATQLEVETHLVTAATAFVENVVKCVQRAGLQIEEIVVEPLATGLAVLTDAERQLGVALADIGGGTTDVALWVDGAITHTHIIPIGGNHFSYDLSVGFRLSPEDAERVKVSYAAARANDVSREEYIEIQMIGEEEPREIPRPLLTEIVGPRVEQLFKLLRQHVDAAREDGVYVTTTVLSGGGCQLLGLPEMAQQIMEMPVRVGVPRDIIDNRGLIDSPVYATAAGMLRFAAQRSGVRRSAKEPRSIAANAVRLLMSLFRRRKK
jgi:cell division protein FtsA